MPRFLLDTNTCIAVMRHHPTAVQRMAAVAPGDRAISTVTAYELYTGRSRSGRLIDLRDGEYRGIQPGSGLASGELAMVTGRARGLPT